MYIQEKKGKNQNSEIEKFLFNFPDFFFVYKQQ